MKYKKVIEYPKSHLESYELMFDYGEEELIKYEIPRLENIKTWTAEFENGFSIDVKLNASEDDVWSEAVLFDDENHQVAFTDVSYQIEGAWIFDYEGDEYEVDVKGV